MAMLSGVESMVDGNELHYTCDVTQTVLLFVFILKSEHSLDANPDNRRQSDR
jgi:hypothetical protein